MYDWWRLVEEDAQSIGLFIKWTCIFAIFMYGVPQLRIPWLEWSIPTSNLAFLLHATLVGMLMFRIPVG
jgi:nucleoporin POM152